MHTLRQLLGSKTPEVYAVAPGDSVIDAIRLITVGVGVARDIEPLDRHALAVSGRGEQTINDFLVGVR